MTLPSESRTQESLYTLARIITGREAVRSIPMDQWAVLAPLAVKQGLGPMLYWVLDQSSTRLDPLAWESLERSARKSAAHFAVLAGEQKRLGAALEGAGIPEIWLKGIALGSTVYPEPWCRPMEDLDVLVTLDQIDPAVRVAKELGYRRTEGDYLAMVGAPESAQNHVQLRGGPGRAIYLEIHFRLLGVSGNRWLPPAKLARFWEQTRPIGRSGLAGLTLQPEAHLLYLCAHALLQHGEAYLNLRQLLDLHLLVTKENLDWQQVSEEAREFGWVYATDRALALAQEFFGTPIPEQARKDLTSGQRGDASRATAIRLQQPTARWEEWRALFFGQSHSKRLRLVWVSLFPPQAYIRDLYSLSPGSRILPYYILRLWDGSREAARSLISGWKQGDQR